jgi:hypothetical protein
MGYGATGSGVYIDPGASPGLYIQALVERAPVLLFGQWALPSGLYMMFSQHAAQIFWLVAVGLVMVVGALLLPLLKRDRAARFFALGMVLSLLPACATFPDDRLLFFVGVGGIGLLAQFMAAVRQPAEWIPTSRLPRLPFQAAFWVFVVLHLVFAPLGLATTSISVKTFGAFIETAADSLPTDPLITDQTVLIVNTPSVFISIYGPLMQGLRGRPVPNRTLVLGSSIYPITIHRTGRKSMTIRPDGGYMPPPGSAPPGQEETLGVLHPGYFHQMLDGLYRDGTPMIVGDSIDYGGATLEVTEVTDHGRPAEVICRFDVALEDPSLRWLQWENGVYVPFELPAVGHEVTLPAVEFPWWE